MSLWQVVGGVVLVIAGVATLRIMGQRAAPYAMVRPTEGARRVFSGAPGILFFIALMAIAIGSGLILLEVLPDSWLTWFTGR